MEVCNIPAKATCLLCTMQKGRYRMDEEDDALSSASSVAWLGGGGGRVDVTVSDASPVDRPYHVPRKKTAKAVVTHNPSHLTGRGLALPR